MGLVAVTFLVNAAHGLGGDRMSWGILVSVGTSTVKKWSFFENNRVAGAVSRPWLPHHRTYRSVYGGSRRTRKSAMLVKKAD